METFVKLLYSFRLGHHQQVKGNKPWGRRQKRPFVAKDKKDAQKIIRLVLQKVGIPPLEFLYQLLNNPKGGALS